MFTAAEINAAIAAGRTVTARAADVARKGQPGRGVEVTVDAAYSEERDGRVRVTARGYRGRFAAEILEISGVDFD